MAHDLEALEEAAHAMLDSVREQDLITVEEAYFGMATVDRPAYRERHEVSEQLIDLLMEKFPLFGRISLAWRAESGAGGETEMPDFDTITDPNRWYEDMTTLRVFDGPAVIIDQHPRAGDHHLILLPVSGDLDQLWVYNGNYGDPAPLETDFDTFQQALLDFRAGYGWEWIFTDPARCGWEEGIRSQLGKLVTQTRALFDVDLSPYAEELERWGL